LKRASELIEITNRLDYSNDYEKFYEFAQNFIMHMKAENNTKTEGFFKTIKLILNNVNDATVKNALGIESKHNKVEAIKEWCKHISESEELKQLELAELHYVFGYATRKAKIAEASKNTTVGYKSKKNEPPKTFKSESKVADKDTKSIKCKNKKCRKSFEVQKSQPFPQLKETVCPYCESKFKDKY